MRFDLRQGRHRQREGTHLTRGPKRADAKRDRDAHRVCADERERTVEVAGEHEGLARRESRGFAIAELRAYLLRASEVDPLASSLEMHAQRAETSTGIAVRLVTTMPSDGFLAAPPLGSKRARSGALISTMTSTSTAAGAWAGTGRVDRGVTAAVAEVRPAGGAGAHDATRNARASADDRLTSRGTMTMPSRMLGPYPAALSPGVWLIGRRAGGADVALGVLEEAPMVAQRLVAIAWPR